MNQPPLSHHAVDAAPASGATVNRRSFLSAVGRGLAAFAGFSLAEPLARGTLLAEGLASAAPMTVYKDPGCGCCKEWVKIMEKAGFVVTARDTGDMNSVKSSMGVPNSLQSCHTAVVAGYVVEGHVPADVVLQLLKEKPIARGLAVPGMPNGSPGMEGAVKDKYDVLLFERTGKTRVYASR